LKEKIFRKLVEEEWCEIEVSGWGALVERKNKEVEEKK